jgi:hypothetical protein
VTQKITDIVAVISKMKDLTAEQMFDRVGELFPDAKLEQIDRAFRIAADDEREEARRLTREADAIDHVRPVFDGMPKNTTLREAAESKTQLGDPVATALLAHLNSPTVRLSSALWVAACEADTERWRKSERGFRWIRKGKPPECNEMIDWFQMTYPAKAREIEQEISKREENR